MEISDRVFAKFLGQQIRRAREARGWTRVQVVERLPSGISQTTLLSYEHGNRYVTAVRLVEICHGLGVAASEILRRAEVAAADLTGHVLLVDLQAVKKDTGGFAGVAEWARRRLLAGDSGTARLEPATVREMAAMLDVRHEELAAYLAGFAVG